jgi:hypothetical protein
MTGPRQDERRSSIEKVLAVVDVVCRISTAILRLFGRRKTDKTDPRI